LTPPSSHDPDARRGCVPVTHCVFFTTSSQLSREIGVSALREWMASVRNQRCTKNVKIDVFANLNKQHGFDLSSFSVPCSIYARAQCIRNSPMLPRRTHPSSLFTPRSTRSQQRRRRKRLFLRPCHQTDWYALYVGRGKGHCQGWLLGQVQDGSPYAAPLLLVSSSSPPR